MAWSSDFYAHKCRGVISSSCAGARTGSMSTIDILMTIPGGSHDHRFITALWQTFGVMTIPAGSHDQHFISCFMSAMTIPAGSHSCCLATIGPSPHTQALCVLFSPPLPHPRDHRPADFSASNRQPGGPRCLVFAPPGHGSLVYIIH